MKELVFLGVVFLAVVLIDSLEDRVSQEEYWEPEPERYDLYDRYPFYRSLN